ncbi:MAG: hypothetical protein ACOY94_12335 [Bacillota bacterium]
MQHKVIVTLLLIWLMGYRFVDWSRLRELLPAILTGVLLAGVPTALPGLEPLYTLRSSHTENYHWIVLYLVQMSAAPVISAWFAQGLPRTGPLPWQRVAQFGLLCWALELPGYYAGRLVYAPWWGPFHSLLLHLGFLSLMALVHFYACGSPHLGGDRSVREVKKPGVLRPSGSSHMDPQWVDR